jgi:cytochrome c peroxidase
MGERTRRVVLAASSALAAVVLAVGARQVRWHSDAADGHIRPRPATAARRVFEGELDSLGLALETLGSHVRTGDIASSRAAFRAARIAYRRVECLLAVYAPVVAAELNGPLPETGEDRPAGPLGAPAGFQIVEAHLFGGAPSPGRDSAQATVRAMSDAVRALRPLTTYLDMQPAAVLDALRLEIARVATLELAGFDTDRSGDGVVEAATALDGARTVAQTTPAGRAVDSTLAAAAAYLRTHPRFDDLDRLEFVVSYANPASRAVAAARAAFPPPLPLRRLWRQGAATLFEPGAFDPAAYAADFAPPASSALIVLGGALFRDPRLSTTGTRSCATCHDPARAFTDGRARSAPLAGHSMATRNTPTLWNAAYQPALFDDLRAGSLERQAEMVLASPVEMGAGAESAAARLRADAAARAQFARALGVRPDSAVTGRAIRVALAAYVRSLVALNSPFDRAARGDTAALAPAARRGFTLFMGKGHCGTCHFLPLFNGTMPPEFVTSEPEIIGVPTRPVRQGARLDLDAGRGGVDHEATHQAAFRVPTLRNIALTAPYMHNGSFATLAQVIEFYNRGGGAGVGARVPGQTLPARPLHLSRPERRDLEAFLRALTDTVATTD